MPRHVMKILAPAALALFGLAACAHHGVKPAAPATGAMTAPSAATSTHAISATHEVATAPQSSASASPAVTATSHVSAAAAESAAAPAATAAMPAPTAQTASAPAAASMPMNASSAAAAATAMTATSAAEAASSTLAPTGTTAATTAGEISGPNLPVRGMSMANVEHIFGAPLQKLPAVPDPGTKLHPPITRWIYPTYVVYFEYNYVVHTVLKAHPFKNGDTDNP